MTTRDPVSGNWPREIKEQVSNKLIYEGRTDTHNAEFSDPVWQVSRTTVNGKTTETVFANYGKDDQRWDLRASLFPAAQFDNEYSVLLDGIGDRVEFGDAFNYNTTNQWSFSLWFKVDNLATQQCLYAKATNDVQVNGYGFYIRPDGKIFMQIRSGGSGPNHFSTATFSAGVWNHFVFTFNGGGNQNGARLYFNGSADAVPASAGLGDVLSNQVAMLGSRNGSFNFSGYIDEFSVWNKELSAADVSELYNGGTPLDATGHSSSDRLKHYYRLGDGDAEPTALDNAGSVNGTLIGDAEFSEEAP